MEYAIIFANDLLELTDKVNKFCDLGWEPQGGVFLDPRTNLYCQPVVLDKDDGAQED